MYNPLLIKNDLLNIGNLKLQTPPLRRFCNQTGYNVTEHYRVFNKQHELNIMLGFKQGQSNMIITTTDYDHYYIEPFKYNTLAYLVRKLNTTGITELKAVLNDTSNSTDNIINKMNNTDLKNEMHIYLNNMKLQVLALTSMVCMLAIYVYSVIINNM